MNNRIVSIIFTRRLMKQGIKASNLEDLMGELPEGTNVTGFGEDICRDVIQINITHDKFKEVEVGSIVPEIVAKFTIDENGIEDCEIDFSKVLEDGYKTQCDDNTDWRVKIVHDEAIGESFTSGTGIISLSEGDHGKIILCSTPSRYGKSWIQSYMEKQQEIAKSFSMMSKDSKQKPRICYPVGQSQYTGVDQATMSPEWWNDDDYKLFDIDEPKDDSSKKKECEHKWKKVMGINRYYVICEHCEVRNKEEEEKQWE